MHAQLIKARTFLRALQRAPEPVRRKWQRGISAAAFVVVIAGWMVYMNLSLAPTVTPTATPRGEEGGFFETLGKGFNVLGSALSEEWVKLRSWGNSLWGGLDAQLSKPSVLTFVREENAFTPAPYEAIPSVMLPIR